MTAEPYEGVDGVSGSWWATPAWERGQTVQPLTREQARRVARIAATADGGCVVCVRELADQLSAAWPTWPWQAWMLEEEEEES